MTTQANQNVEHKQESGSELRQMDFLNNAGDVSKERESSEKLDSIIDGTSPIREMVDNLDNQESVENVEDAESEKESFESKERKAKNGAATAKKKDEQQAHSAQTSAAKQLFFPQQKKMVAEIRKNMKKEMHSLEKEAKKYSRSSNFMPHKLTEVVAKIRRLRELISNLVIMAIEKIKKLYTQWVVNKNFVY